MMKNKQIKLAWLRFFAICFLFGMAVLANASGTNQENTKASLRVEYLPAGSRVFLDMKDSLGVTPNAFAGIEAGYYQVRIVNDDCKVQIEWIKLEPGKEVCISGELMKSKEGESDFNLSYSPLLKEAAEHGNLLACKDLSVCYQYGLGVELDKQKAVEWINKAVELGDAEAMAMLALYYHIGFGVEKDDAKARELFIKAYELGDKSVKEIVRSMGLHFSE